MAISIAENKVKKNKRIGNGPFDDLSYLSPALRQKKAAGYFYPAARGQSVYRPMMSERGR
jgi:hypothetical protein